MSKPGWRVGSVPIFLAVRRKAYKMTEIAYSTILLKNVIGMLEEFAENYPVWNMLSEYEQLDFDTELRNAVAQYEALLDVGEVDEKQQVETITQRMCEIKPKLVKLNLLLPKGI